MQKISWGIIGCGSVTEVKSGPAFNKVPNSELIAVMRRDGKLAADYARRHQVRVWYDNANALINDPAVNAIYVATPPSSHLEYAIQALRAGKPVYLEKPMTPDASSALELLSEVNNLNGKLSVAHYRRELPYFKSIRDTIKAGKIGRPQSVRLRLIKPFSESDLGWRVDPSLSGGGLFHDLAPHQLDFLYYCFGVPVECSGRSENRSMHYNADDFVEGRILFAEGIWTDCTWSFAENEQEQCEECEIAGTEGVLKFNFFTMKAFEIRSNNSTETFYFETPLHVQQPMIHRVVDYFLGNGQNPCSCMDGLHVMNMIDALTGKRSWTKQSIA